MVRSLHCIFLVQYKRMQKLSLKVILFLTLINKNVVLYAVFVASVPRGKDRGTSGSSRGSKGSRSKKQKRPAVTHTFRRESDDTLGSPTDAYEVFPAVAIVYLIIASMVQF